jgi:hypothetical protein
MITWWAAVWTLKRGGEDLAREAADLRRLIGMVLTGLEQGGMVKLKRDAAGRIESLKVELRGHATLPSLVATGTATVEPPASQPHEPGDED